MDDNDEITQPIPRTPVVLIAFDYEWTCPNCGETHRCERTSEVECDHCGGSFPVKGIENG